MSADGVTCCAQDFAKELVEVQQLQKKADAAFSALVAYFGENPNSIPSDSTFWAPIAKFAQIFTATQNEILKKKLVPLPPPPSFRQHNVFQACFSFRSSAFHYGFCCSG